MNHQAARNYLKAHRKKSGLSQEDMGKLLGYTDPGQISRHERSMSIPPLTIALAYEAIFREPISAIFIGMYEEIQREIENKLRQLETELGNRSATDPDANLVAQQLVWLNERKSK